MKNFVTLIGCAILFAGSSSMAAHASDLNPKSGNAGKFAVGLGVGTTGGTVEGKYAVSDSLVVRGSLNLLKVSVDDEYDDIDYDAKFDATTFGGFVDFAPFKNGFVLSGGAYLGDKTLDLDATPANSVEIGDQTFTPDEVGTLTGKAELNSFAPYVGIGYDGFMGGSKSWSFNARAGVMFTGSPEVDLVSANGTLSSDATLRNEIDAEIQAIEEDADDFKYYPVLTIGIARRF